MTVHITCALRDDLRPLAIFITLANSGFTAVREEVALDTCVVDYRRIHVIKGGDVNKGHVSHWVT